MTVTMHYGIHIDSDKPATGVRQNSRLGSAFWDTVNQGIDLAWEDHLKECQGTCDNCHCSHPNGSCDCYYLAAIGDPCSKYEGIGEHDKCGPQERGDVLIGSWKKDAEGKYEPDETGEYAAIVRELVTQVVWSKTTFRGALCSPCYPGQVDDDTPGQYLGYDLPADMTGEG